jgi:hypothetical protein
MSFLYSGRARCLCGGLICLLILNTSAKAQELPDLKEAMKVAKAAAPLTQEERTLAVRLAEEALRAKKLLPDKKTFLAAAQTYRNTEAEKAGSFERHALLTYYRYEGDVGILVYANLGQRRAKVEELPHFPAPLAPEELQRARDLALNHPELKKVLEPFRDRLIVEALLTRSPTSKEPLFGHRLVNLLFRVGPRYLSAQGMVLVDLTTEQVTVTPPRMGDNDSKH